MVVFKVSNHHLDAIFALNLSNSQLKAIAWPVLREVRQNLPDGRYQYLHRRIDFWSRSCADPVRIHIHIFPAQPFSIFIEQHPDLKGAIFKFGRLDFMAYINLKLAVSGSGFKGYNLCLTKALKDNLWEIKKRKSPPF